MYSETKQMWVGGGVVVALGLLLGVSYGGGQSSEPETDGYTVEATFNRVDGLVPGDEVRMGGIRVGSVYAQKLDAHYRAVLTLSINDGVKLPLDSSAAIHTDGLFGAKYIVLEPGGEEDYMENGAVIEMTQEATIVSELLELIINQGRAQRAAEGEGAK